MAHKAYFSTLGEVRDLTSNMVDGVSISKLRAQLMKPTDVYPVDCKKCGAERSLRCIDPGDTRYLSYECKDVDTRFKCNSPPMPRITKRVLPYVPGSFVFAPLIPHTEISDPKARHTSSLWPGIVEPCPQGDDGYKIMQKSGQHVKAYFVTFIYPEVPDRRWAGGFIDSRFVYPFVQLKDFPAPPEMNKVDYDASVKLARESLKLSLRQRLLRFSYVAYIASSRKIILGQRELPATNFWAKFFAKRSNEDSPAENVPKLVKLELIEESEPSEDDDTK